MSLGGKETPMDKQVGMISAQVVVRKLDELGELVEVMAEALLNQQPNPVLRSLLARRRGDCPQCCGKGTLRTTWAPFSTYTDETCPTCNGKGALPGQQGDSDV